MPKFSISKTHRPLTTTLKRPLFRRRPPHPLSNREIIRFQSGRTTNDDRERTNAVRGLPVVTPPYTIMTGQRVRQSRSACATHTRRGGAREKRAERPFRGQIKHSERRAHCNIASAFLRFWMCFQTVCLRGCCTVYAINIAIVIVFISFHCLQFYFSFKCGSSVRHHHRHLFSQCDTFLKLLLHIYV